ncbi:MAG: hypothetical protein ACSHYA_03330 [Opitutaceae bacterium]
MIHGIQSRGNILISRGSNPDSIKTWDTKTGELIKDFLFEPEVELGFLLIDKRGSICVSAGYDSFLFISLDDGKVIEKLEHSDLPVDSTDYVGKIDQNGNFGLRLVSFEDNVEIKLVIDSNQMVSVIEKALPDAQSQVSLFSEKNYKASISKDTGTVSILNNENELIFGSYNDQEDNGFLFIDESDSAVTLFSSKSLSIYILDDKTTLEIPTEHEYLSYALSQDANQVALLKDNGHFFVKNTKNGTTIWETSLLLAEDFQYFPYKFCFSEDGDKLFYIERVGTSIATVDLNIKAPHPSIPGHKFPIEKVEFSFDGSKFISKDSKNNIRIWNSKDFSQIEVQHNCSALQYNRSLSQLAYIDVEKQRLIISDINTGESSELPFESNWSYRLRDYVSEKPLAYSPSGLNILTLNYKPNNEDQGKVHIINSETGIVETSIPHGKGTPIWGVFSHDGNRVAIITTETDSSI